MNIGGYNINIHFLDVYFTTLFADGCSLHVNCGGDDFVAEDDNRKVLYEGDGGVEGGVATYFRSNDNYWGFSATGDFMDDADLLSIRHIIKLSGSNLSDLYATARITPITLTYFAYCLGNGNYSVKLHFAEIQFTNDRSYDSLGRRMFDIYIQVISCQSFRSASTTSNRLLP